MPSRIEISLKSEWLDSEGETLRRKAQSYFNIDIDTVRTVNILTIDAELSHNELLQIQNDIFTNPVTHHSSIDVLPIPADWIVWIGFRPGVRDNAGATAVEAIEDLLGKSFQNDEAAYTSKRYCLSGPYITEADVRLIAEQLLANDIIQQWQVFSKSQWDPDHGIGYPVPKVMLNHVPTVTAIAIDSDATLQKLSDERNLALNPNDIPIIRAYFLDKTVRSQRTEVGLSDPTDLELEYISQARSDHCNHNTFQGLFRYEDASTGQTEVIDNLFQTCIKAPTLELKAKKPWVVSVLWDNAGVGRFDDQNYYTITGETHNSPSNMEAYGGAITGIVGIYRDPMGTGKGSRLIMGSYGFCVGHRNYQGPLKPKLHPRRLLDGIIEGVRDGGNKSGIPTPFGQVMFHPGYMGKCLVYVTALGIMPALIDGKPSEQKTIPPGDLVIMCGGRVGKDGIHGVTASSETFSEHTPAGHVQIGDPYTQKKMHDFLLEARDEGLIRYITDNGGGGLSSSVGESARESNGVYIELDKVPLKYQGLDQWEIWVSESQERMTVAIAPEHENRFFELSRKHAVESTIIGRYTDSGKLHITYKDRICAYIDLDLLTAKFPQWEFDAQWRDPGQRGLYEPVIKNCRNHNQLILDIISRPNICSKAWISRQYDHEVQGTSVIKPLVGAMADVPSDAAVIRPVLGSNKGLVFSQAMLPFYSAIDAFHMTSCTIDEAVRRLIAVGGNLDHIGGVDNFCWPTIQHDDRNNPDGKFKAAQLVRSCQALRDMCLAYGIPLLSGKDSMYVDGHLTGPYGETRKVSALESLQFSATSVMDDIELCQTMDLKASGDLLYVLGMTRDELGASEYYEHMGYIGCNVPKVIPDQFLPLYGALANAIKQDLVASVHGVYRGGLGVHLAMTAIAGMFGIDVDLSLLSTASELSDETRLYSESAGRFIVSIDSAQRDSFESLLTGQPFACIGRVIEPNHMVVRGCSGQTIIDLPLAELKAVWQKPFGNLI